MLQDQLAGFGSWYLMLLGLIAILVMRFFPRACGAASPTVSTSSLFPIRRHLVPRDGTATHPLVPEAIMIETDVLIVGSGSGRLRLGPGALDLRHPQCRGHQISLLADTLRAHITNQRTMEVFRDLGIEDEVNEKRRGLEPRWATMCSLHCSLAGEELGRLYSWGNHPSRLADYTLSSPTTICDVPQNLLEPILLGNAAARGSRVRFDSEYLALEPGCRRRHRHGARPSLRRGLPGPRQIPHRRRWRPLQVAEDIGLPMQGRMGVAGSMNIVFEADLSR